MLVVFGMGVQLTHSSKPCRHGHRIPRKRSRLVNPAERRNLLHHVQTAAISAHRHASADNLAESGQVRLDAVQPLGTVDTHTESRHDLVHNQ